MASCGIIGSFAPGELAAYLRLAPTQPLPLGIQMASALLFAFGIVNWMARGSAIGGIYNRPLAVGNVAHFTMGALALLKSVIAGQRHPVIVVACVLYAVFALLFAGILFRSPVRGAGAP